MRGEVWGGRSVGECMGEWGSVLGCGRGVGRGVVKYVGLWGENKKRCGVCEESCGRVYGVSGEVCWGVGGGEEKCVERYGGCGWRCREVCWGVVPQRISSHTSHISPQDFSFISLTYPTPTHFPTPTYHISPHLPLHSNTLSHIFLHTSS